MTKAGLFVIVGGALLLPSPLGGEGLGVRGDDVTRERRSVASHAEPPHPHPSPPSTGERGPKGDLAAELHRLDPWVVAPKSEEGKALRKMLSADIRARRDAVNLRESKAWRGIKDRDGWERYRNPRLEALRKSLGTLPKDKGDLNVRVTGRRKGDGFVIENVVYQSRPGLLVTANLYLPAESKSSMPGIIICHSHHNPKTQGELQDMGMTWARQGAMVLIMDQIGHGERRQHPFIDSKSFPGSFKAGRQDYYFRYNVALQLHLAGESLVGWMAWDMMRGVDLLLSKPGIDPKRIMLLGAVAGGGDPCAVTAALDDRIAAAVPFNFGGPQPESRFPLPENAEDSFNYAGGGSWESTRNLRLSCRDGFLPWVIVGGIAPRGLIYAHEFAWDEKKDPVWKRLQTIYGFYDADDRLAFAHGTGALSGKPPESSHCNNIGAVHRVGIYPPFKSWFNMPIPEKEYRERIPAKDLQCLTADSQTKPIPVCELAGEIARDRVLASRQHLAKLAPAERKRTLRQKWAAILGEVEPGKFTAHAEEEKLGDGMRLWRMLLIQKAEVAGHSMTLPMFLFWPAKKNKKMPVVVAVAQEGKRGFLQHRAEAIAALLDKGIAVCLPDLRGTGETQPEGDGRGRASVSTSLSASELMLGRTMLGSRLRELRTILAYLREREECSSLALWGDSFVTVNPPDTNVEMPWDASSLPVQAEPLGGLLAIFGALFEDDVRAIYARGGLASFESVLRSPFIWLPHDVIVPGAMTVSELDDVTAALAPRPVRLEGMVDGLNRRVSDVSLAETYALTRKAFKQSSERFQARAEPASAAEIAAWFSRTSRAGH